MSNNHNRPRDGRVPPHNLAAEEAMLGAALLSLGAAQLVGSAVAVGDFYKPSHQHIAHAVAVLLDNDNPRVDVVLVANELRQAGMLDDIGGTSALLELTNATPSVGSAPKYAQIVKNCAVLRRLIATAATITELGYESHDDPTGAIVRAGALLADMDPGDAATLSTLEVADIAALLAGDLEPQQPALLTRTDGGALLYPGMLHTFQAEPSSGKSFVALVAVVQVLALGGAAAYIDNEDSPSGILGRLLALGASPAALAARFYYVQPLGRFGPAERLEFWRAIDRLNFDLVVIDGVGESLAREGLSEDKAEDVLRWFDLLPRPIARTGAAVLMLDHVAKDPEQRGRWARGSGAKLAAIDGATYQLKVRQSFARTRSGRVDLIIAKDRPGGVGAIGETAATVRIEPQANGERVQITIDPHTAEVAPTDSWKPTVLMGKVWQAVHESSAPLTATAVGALVHSDKPRLVREAIARLLAEGFIAETGRRPKVLRTVKPYTGSPALAAPAWRGEPPAELFEEHDGPSPDELDEVARQRAKHDPHYFDHPEF